MGTSATPVGGHRLKGLLRATLIGGALAVLLVLALQPLFVLALTSARSLADFEAVRAHLRTGFEQGAIDADGRPKQWLYRHGSQFSECVTIQISLDDQKDPIRAALMPQVLGAFVSPCRELHDLVFGKPVTERTDYSRYWHGYRVYFWPLLTWFDLPTMRAVNALILFACLLVFWRGLRAALDITPALIFMIVLLSLTDILRMWTVTQHSLSTALILAGSGLFALMHRRWPGPVPALVYAAGFGAVFNFVDALINPPFAPLLLAFLTMAMQPRPAAGTPLRDYRLALTFAALVALSFFGGYALTWAMKWVMAILFAHDSAQMAKDIYEQIVLRTFGHEKDRYIYFIPLWPTVQMFYKSFVSIGSPTVAAIAAALFFYLRENWASFDRGYFLAVTMPALIPVLWFEIMSNHTQTHLHFVYRSEAAAIAMVLASVVSALSPQPSIWSLWTTLRRNVAASWSGRGTAKDSGPQAA
jgi:hypothetical protein